MVNLSYMLYIAECGCHHRCRRRHLLRLRRLLRRLYKDVIRLPGNETDARGIPNGE